MLISYELPVFSKRAKRRVVSHPKFYFFDVGVFRTLRPMGPLDSPEEAEGPALETLFLQELIALNDYLDLGYTINYWRTSNDLEVDFVLYGKRGIKAFEIKRTGKPSPSHFSSLKAFLRDYPMAQAYFAYGGERRMKEREIQIWPIADCLRDLPGIL